MNADVGHVLYNGRLACKGNPLDLIDEIGSHGYDKCVECADYASDKLTDSTSPRASTRSASAR